MEHQEPEMETKTSESLVGVEDYPITARKKCRPLHKIDHFILPLIAIVYFYAAMVSLPSLCCVTNT